MKAYKITVRGHQYQGAYVAPSAGKARYHAYRDINDLGGRVTFPDLKVHRAPAYDFLADRVDRQRSFSLESILYILDEATRSVGRSPDVSVGEA